MMANKKELKELIESLKRKVGKVLAARDKVKGKASDLKQEVGRLEGELALAREQSAADRARIAELEHETARLTQQLAGLQQRLAQTTEPPAGGAKGGVALAQRDAWKRAKFLQDRYEYYLEKRKGKAVARQSANRDLMDKFGEDAGYSDEHLEEILL